MTTLRDIFTAFAPEYLERYPHLPLAHRKVISAIQHCQSGHYGHSLYACPTCGGHHRVQHSCGNRHCPQCQQHKTQQWLQHHLDKQLPGPHFLMTFTVPETLRPFIRSHQRPAYQAMFHASATALKRLAQDERFIGTDLPGFTGVLHTWGRQLQYHPHLHYIVPGGGLSADHAAWMPSRANFFVPVKALSPIYRALFKDAMRQAGLLEQIDPQVWTIPWNVHSQANHHGHSAFTYLAPYVFKVAISNHRIVSLTDRTVTFTYRKVGSARLRMTYLDAIEFIRRFLQHVLPDGFQKVRHFGFLHASCPVPLVTIRRMIVQAPPGDDPPPPRTSPPPRAARCPTCGTPMRLVMRLWTSSRGFVDTG
jgi:putative transposase/transposase-like zinc-binding protein